MTPVNSPCLGTKSAQLMPGIDCVQRSTGVQSADTAADLRKVTEVSARLNLERTPSLVGGRVERFGDIAKMIDKWEMLEEDDKEWKVEEGIRRGGRRLSRRVSELLGGVWRVRGLWNGRTGYWWNTFRVRYIFFTYMLI